MAKQAKIITISSGKGGVGKTSVAVNTGILLAKQGYKTCIVDADANLANINIMLKLTPEHTLEQVLQGEMTIKDITLNYAGLDIIPGGSGLSSLITLTSRHLRRIINAIQSLRSRYDFLIIDTPAGISKSVLSYINISQLNLIVITSEPTSLTDAFSLIRVAVKNTSKSCFNIIVNKAENKQQADEIYQRFSTAVNKYIKCKINYLSHIVSDDLVTSAVCSQTPVVIKHPSSAAAQCFQVTCKKLLPDSTPHSHFQSAHSYPAKRTPVTDDLIQKTLSKPVTQPHTHNQQKKPESLGEIKSRLIEIIKHNKVNQTALTPALLEILNSFLEQTSDPDTFLTQLLKNPVVQRLNTTEHIEEPAVPDDEKPPVMNKAENLPLACSNIVPVETDLDNLYIRLRNELTETRIDKPKTAFAADPEISQHDYPESLLDSIRFASKLD